MEEITYHYQTAFNLREEEKHTDWIIRVLEDYGSKVGELSFIYVSDEVLLQMNQEYLSHDYYTDIITFEYQEIEGVSGDLYISTDRVMENAAELNCSVESEVRRVMIHGVLHLLGYGDKSVEEARKMRELEEATLKLFHVKHISDV